MKMIKKQIEERIKGLSDEQARNVVCALVGHSRVVNICLGRVSCSRCGAVVGDVLLGIGSLKDIVIVGHDCETCRTNYKGMGWQDKMFASDPF